MRLPSKASTHEHDSCAQMHTAHITLTRTPRLVERDALSEAFQESMLVTRGGVLDTYKVCNTLTCARTHKRMGSQINVLT